MKPKDKPKTAKKSYSKIIPICANFYTYKDLLKPHKKTIRL